MTKFNKRPKTAGPNDKKLAVVKAWQNIQRGNGTVGDFETILIDLWDVTGYQRRPRYSDWIAKTKTPHGFELHSALSNARAEVVQHIMDHLTIDDDALIALERAARAEANR